MPDFEIPKDAKQKIKDFVVKKVGRKWLEVTEPGKRFVMKLAIGPQTAHLKAGDTVEKLPVAEVREESRFGVQVTYYPLGEKAAAELEGSKRKAEIDRWLSYVEDAANRGYVYEKGVARLRELNGLEDPEVKKRVDAAVQKVAAAKEAQRQQRARERAERYEEWSKRREETAGRRVLFPVKKPPVLNKPVRLNGKWVVFTGSGKTFRIDDDHISMGASHLIGHEGDMGAYFYFRDATEDEIAQANVEREQVANRAENRDAATKGLRSAIQKIRQEGTRPENATPGGEVVYDTFNAYGGGERIMIDDDKIWFIQNNGADGANWSMNNVRTGGAGAIGWYVPKTNEIEQQIRSAVAGLKG